MVFRLLGGQTRMFEGFQKALFLNILKIFKPKNQTISWKSEKNLIKLNNCNGMLFFEKCFEATQQCQRYETILTMNVIRV